MGRLVPRCLRAQASALAKCVDDRLIGRRLKWPTRMSNSAEVLRSLRAPPRQWWLSSSAVGRGRVETRPEENFRGPLTLDEVQEIDPVSI